MFHFLVAVFTAWQWLLAGTLVRDKQLSADTLWHYNLCLMTTSLSYENLGLYRSLNCHLQVVMRRHKVAHPPVIGRVQLLVDFVNAKNATILIV